MRTSNVIAWFLTIFLFPTGGVLGTEEKLVPGNDRVDTPAVATGLCVHNLFQSSMVIQRGKPIPIWGWAAPNEKVTVTLGDESRSTTAAAGASPPWRPYNKDYVAGNWRGQWDFDSGARLLDWGTHTMDLCQMANQADDTMPIEYMPTPKGIDCRYANGLLLEIDFLKDPFGERPGWIQSNGTCPVRFIGEKGWVETGDGGEVHLALDGKATEVMSEGKPARGADVVNHLRDFFDCVKIRKPTAANSTIMRRSHIACHAAALSWILQRPLKFDPTTESFVNDDEANRLTTRPQRTDWA